MFNSLTLKSLTFMSDLSGSSLVGFGYFGLALSLHHFPTRFGGMTESDIFIPGVSFLNRIHVENVQQDCCIIVSDVHR